MPTSTITKRESPVRFRPRFCRCLPDPMDEHNQVSEQREQSLASAPLPAPELAGNNGVAADAETKAWGVAVAGWLLPGLGHALLKMWGRAAVVFFTVGALVVAGATMRGNLFSARGSDAFDELGT